MPFRGLQTKARNDPLGPGGMVQLTDNMLYLRTLAQKEHIAGTGEHNVWQVPRRLVTISGTTATPSSSDVTSVTNPAVGTHVIALDLTRFTSDLRPQINIDSDQIRLKPCIAGYKVVYTTGVSTSLHLEVYIKKLSSALGAGNSWGTNDSQFNVALHSEPLSAGQYTADAAGHVRGDTLTEASTDWNAHAQAHGDMNAMLTAAHTSAGAHNVYEVAKQYAYVDFKPGGSPSYEISAASSGIAGVNRVSTGVVEVTYSALTAPQAAFVCPDYQRVYNTGFPSDLYVMNAERNSTTKHTVYIYKYDGANWSVDDADFFIVVHGS